MAGSPYHITPSGAVGTGLENYTISYVDGSLAVNPAGLTIAADNAEKLFGESITFRGTEFQTAGLQNSEAIETVTLTSAGTAGVAPVNTYSITPSAPRGKTFVAENYSIVFKNGVLTVHALPGLQLAKHEDSVHVTFATLSSRKYQLQYCDDLLAPDWRKLGEVVDGTGGPMTTTNQIELSSAYFRLKIGQ